MAQSATIKDLIRQAKYKRESLDVRFNAFYDTAYVRLLAELKDLGFSKIEFNTRDYGYKDGPFITVTRIGLDNVDNKLSFYQDQTHSSPIGETQGSFCKLKLTATKSMVLDGIERYIEKHYEDGIVEIDAAIKALECI